MFGTSKTLAGPVAMANGTYLTDIFTPPASTILTEMTQIHVVNKGAGDLTFRLYKGATGTAAAGTEIAYNVNVPVGSYIDLFFRDFIFKSTDFLVGGASGADLVVTVMGKQAVVP